MKFTEGDKLTWGIVSSSIEKVEQYFRSIGGITVEEFTHKMKEEYNGNNK